MPRSCIVSSSDSCVHVDGLGGAHLAREVQSVLVDVGDHDMPRAAITRDSHRHDADRSGAGDEYILAHDVEGERGVRCVAERDRESRRPRRRWRGELEHVAGGKRQILRERTRAIHADTQRVAAQVAPAGAAVAAMSAGDVAFARHAVAGLDAAHFAADLDDLARVLVTDGHRHRDGFLRPRVPVVDMHVGAADGRAVDLDEHVVVADRGLRHVLHPDSGFRSSLDQCFHEPAFWMMPRSRPACANAWITWSSCAGRVRGAQLRADPRLAVRHDRKENATT